MGFVSCDVVSGVRRVGEEGVSWESVGLWEIGGMVYM